MIRLPATAGNQKMDTPCMEHEMSGAEVVRWNMVMVLVGRLFLRKHNEGYCDTALLSV